MFQMIFLISFGEFHLGFLLFVLIINDLSSILEYSVDIPLFVDDAKLFSVIKSPNYALKLQSN